MKRTVKQLLLLPATGFFTNRSSGSHSAQSFAPSLLLLLTTLAFGILSAPTTTLPVHAADTDFSDGITVDSTLDTPDDNIGDGICDDGAGNCTLRAAIEEANSDPDHTTILFNITGTPDFTNNSQPGYTIAPQSSLPAITEQVTIDGYSQPGAQANTAPAPQPLNGTLLVELDGDEDGDSNGLWYALKFEGNSDQSETRGLSIYGTVEAIQIYSGEVAIRGNYVGPDATGMIERGNCVGVTGSNGGGSGIHTSAGAKIGGTNPEDRNIISGNSKPYNGCNWASGGYPDNAWVIQGNYVGVAADGLTAMPNGSTGGSGAFSIDDTVGVIVGGSSVAATNIISGNLSHGLAPVAADNLTIRNNYIGVGYDGITSIPNGTAGIGGAGITLGQVTNAAIEDNIISNNGGDGLYFNECHGVIIQGNTIQGNLTSGISVGPDSYDILIGGTTLADSNNISNNTEQGIESRDTPYDHRIFSIIGNSIHSNGDLGIALSYDSPLTNDPLDADTGSNDLLNFPRWTDMEEVSGNTTIDYQLDVPAGDYRIEFFSNTTPDPSGYGEGEEYLGFQNVTSVGSGEQTFSYTLTGTTGVTNLAMTTTEIDGSTPSGFGATSEFGDYLSIPPPDPVVDISITNTLTNPQDVAPGATLNYALQYTNNGPDDLDLTQFYFGNEAFLWYVIHPDLTAADLGGPGPFPGTSIISDAGNPDVGCLWAPNGHGTFFGALTHQDYGVIACFYAGPLTSLPAGDSLNLAFNFTLSNDSELTFGTYAIGSPIPTDPDYPEALVALITSGSMVTAVTNNPGINNFAAAIYPIPQESEEEQSSDNSAVSSGSSLAASGVAIMLPLFASLILLVFGFAAFKKRQRILL